MTTPTSFKRLSGWIGILSVTAAALQAPLAQAEHWGRKDKLQDFVSRKEVLTNARAIDQRGLSKHSLKDRPWSSTYWPDKMGSIAWRYTDFGANKVSYMADMALGWSVNRSKVTNNTGYMKSDMVHKPIAELSDEALDSLSPAEKYDVLMGDDQFTLWNRVIKRVDQLDALNLHALWSGVCHGWAPASLSIPRPLQGVKLKSPSGRTVTFYPDDIKALASMLWGDAFGSAANAQSFVKVEGWQCQTGAKKNGNGRLVDPRCFDVNPAFVHLLLVNQLGLNDRGLVIDRHYRAEVQNQPVYRYESRYFRVDNRKSKPGSVTLDQAKVRLRNADGSLTRYWDPFLNYRSSKAVTLVGVETTVWYSLGNVRPDQASWTDSPAADKLDKLTFRYDLELDEKDEIVGGEWREHEIVEAPTLVEQYKYQHPDIIWLIPPSVKALALGDFDLEQSKSTWDGNGVVPAGWLAASRKSANKTYSDRVRGKEVTRFAPQPLAKVVEVLVKKSRE
jgi:hypothetical protein